MFEAMARKNKVPLAADALPTVSPDRGLSGADIESIVLAGKRAALAAGRSEVTRADLDQALAEFIPSAQGLEKELQELAAVLECTQVAFLPPDWQAKVTQPGGRAQLQERWWPFDNCSRNDMLTPIATTGLIVRVARPEERRAWLRNRSRPSFLRACHPSPTPRETFHGQEKEAASEDEEGETR